MDDETQGSSPAMTVGADPGSGARHQGEQAIGSGAWPLVSYLELAPLPSAVPWARLHARQVLWEWGAEGLRETTELVVTELVTNGVHASRGINGSRFRGHWEPGTPPLRMWLLSNKRRVLIQVWDGNDQRPARHDADLDQISGRGLMLVDALCAKWGAYVLDRSTGKVVWAQVGE